MPGPAHETLVAWVQHRPDLLDLLLRTLGRPGLPDALVVGDSSVRVANPLEVRPDVLLLAEGPRGPWVMVEVQRARDEDKRRRWLAAAGALLDARGAMGDVVVLTHDEGVATWAGTVGVVEGVAGTRLGLWPVVVTLTLETAETLLALDTPELAVFAAWAVHDRSGDKARRVVERAVQAVEVMEPTLREATMRAMISMAGDAMLAVIRELMMNPLVIPESENFRKLRQEIEAIGEARGRELGEARGRELGEARGRELGEARGRELGEARGEARILLKILAARKLPVDDAARARIEDCRDTARLERWAERAMTAASLDDVWAD